MITFVMQYLWLQLFKQCNALELLTNKCTPWIIFYSKSCVTNLINISNRKRKKIYRQSSKNKVDFIALLNKTINYFTKKQMSLEETHFNN